jgi:hypothetical protein
MSTLQSAQSNSAAQRHGSDECLADKEPKPPFPARKLPEPGLEAELEPKPS